MKETKIETFIYEGLGFPVLMVNVPMKKVFGEWAMNINFAQLQRMTLLMLLKKNASLDGKEVRFIRHYLNMSVHKFAEWLGVTHVAVLNWESQEKKMNADTEINMRMRTLNHLNVTDKEFRKIYNQLDRKSIASRRIESAPLEIDAEKIAC